MFCVTEEYVTVLLWQSPRQFWCNLAPITTKNVKSTMFCYSLLYKEDILRPDPQCITVRYRKNNGIRCPTHEKLWEGPSPEYGIELIDDMDLLDGGTVTSEISQRTEGGRGILCQRRHRQVWHVVWCGIQDHVMGHFISWSMTAFSRVCVTHTLNISGNSSPNSVQIVWRFFSPLMKMNLYVEDGRRTNSVWMMRQDRWCASVCISESVLRECWRCPSVWTGRLSSVVNLPSVIHRVLQRSHSFDSFTFVILCRQ